MIKLLPAPITTCGECGYFVRVACGPCCSLIALMIEHAKHARYGDNEKMMSLCPLLPRIKNGEVK